MTVTALSTPLWGKIAELASRYLHRHDEQLVATEYDTRRAAHHDLAAQLAAQVEPALYAEVVRLAARFDEARAALARLETNAQIDPNAPGLTYDERQARAELRKQAQHQLYAAEQASRDAQRDSEQAQSALEAAINAVCAPARTAAVRRVPEAERAAQQLVRDAREDLRWVQCLPGAVLERVKQAQEQAE